MAVRIGWSRTTPGSHGGRIAGGLWLFELHQVDGDRHRHIVVGYLHYRPADLQTLRDRGVKLEVMCVGILRLGRGVTPRLVEDSIRSVRRLGPVIGQRDAVRHVVDRARATAAGT